ncbi:hypothetical protein QR685DRAFT_353003 [Neurospora intermedia]|uniref:Uncharacterized protein n=1 Tax=Neurospora intermedia TaxID=5142 RepID=A0ABR3D6J7_NEUIN
MGSVRAVGESANGRDAGPLIGQLNLLGTVWLSLLTLVTTVDKEPTVAGRVLHEEVPFAAHPSRTRRSHSVFHCSLGHANPQSATGRKRGIWWTREGNKKKKKKKKKKEIKKKGSIRFKFVVVCGRFAGCSSFYRGHSPSRGHSLLRPLHATTKISEHRWISDHHCFYVSHHNTNSHILDCKGYEHKDSSYCHFILYTSTNWRYSYTMCYFSSINRDC